jgi:phosphatidate cytidylyltransferase
MGSLVQRLITGAILAAVVLGALLLLPPVAACLLVAAFLLLGAWEWSAFVTPGRNGPRFAYTAVLGVMLLGLAVAALPAAGLRALLLAGLAWWAVAFAWILRFPTPVPTAVVAVAGVLTLVPAYAGFRALLALPAAPGAAPGPALAILVLGIVWGADIGAYFVGRRIGRTRLAPAVSPGKTWEGVGGGVLAAALVGGAGGVLLGLPPAATVPLALGIAAISVVGDLAESMFKRHVGVKDSGRLFPGHGGVLDRVDSIAAAVPLFVLAGDRLGWLAL